MFYFTSHTFYLTSLFFYLASRISYLASRISYLACRIFISNLAWILKNHLELSRISYVPYSTYLRHFSKGKVMYLDGKNEVQFRFDDLTQLLVLQQACTFYHS